MKHILKIQNVYRSYEAVKRNYSQNAFVLFFAYSEDALNCIETNLNEQAHYIVFEHSNLPKRNTPLILGQCNGTFGMLDISKNNFAFSNLPYLDTALSNQLALYVCQELTLTSGKINSHSLLVGFANYLLRLYLEQEQLSNNSGMGITPFQLARIKSFIADHIDETINISLLSKISNLSLHHFMRMFKRTTGETPHQFVNRLKMEHAKELLKDTDQSIIQVGMEVGVNNPSHFSQLFKTKFGTSPLKYRKTHQNNYITA